MMVELCWGKSAVNNVWRNGPRTLTCGTPDDICTGRDVALLY